ncbi:hypothetical protein Poli38472_003700 [Pythium oligandrum]|uniref:Calponin-homology (CH) domain-containing protein n=1 Tax=Pythium oligandrum TaxID=41045 RepID=A0A8K1CMC3_PYTOL|nr:hypothetical protein Poli38472_003700 [Pythium oligandrum]|eukprot:TMW65935.1 hypothetical protein Poli38472_003700 [Pythium oligandrum]
MSGPVKVRGGGYGLDAELAKRAAERYDYDLEDEARYWVEEITGMEIGDDFGEGLRDGVILCELVNKIHPGVVKRVETKSKMPFKLMENVSGFLRACRAMGVNEFELFETVDLFELKDLGLVVRCIHALGRATQKNYPDFKGPTLGVKESSKNERQFSEEQLAEARNAPSFIAQGSVRTMERADVRKANDLTFGAEAMRSSHRPPPPPPPPSAEKIEMVARARAAPPSPPRSFSRLAQPDGVPTPVTGWPSGGAGWSQSGDSVDAVSNAMANTSVEEPSPSAGLVGLNSSRNLGPTPEEEAQEWIEAVLGEKFTEPFGESLKDGVKLCNLVNTIKPGIVPKVQVSTMPFKQMENITAFIKACRTIGVMEFDLFETVDLFELKNVDLVVKCLHALGRTIQKTMPEYTGPTLGVKESTENKRTFSDAQLKVAAAAVPLLAEGGRDILERRDSAQSASVASAADAPTVVHVSDRRMTISAGSPEEEAQLWIEAVLGEKFTEPFGPSLKDGVKLCSLVNTIKPGIVAKVQVTTMPFKQMENITAFIKACRTIGVMEFDLFETVDLFELKNVDLVVKCLHALGRTIQKTMPEYTGPMLGVKEATENKRTFSDAQLKVAAAAVPLLAEGGREIMERRDFDRSASVTFAADAAVQGLDKKTTVEATSPTSAAVEPSKPSETESPSPTKPSSVGKPDAAKFVTKTSQKLPTRTVWELP